MGPARDVFNRWLEISRPVLSVPSHLKIIHANGSPIYADFPPSIADRELSKADLSGRKSDMVEGNKRSG
jgi:hypothetical protein